jgi:uncharacterized protein (DUF362 family)
MRCWWHGHCDCRPHGRLKLTDRHSDVYACRTKGFDDLLWLLTAVSLPRRLRSVALKLNLCDYRSGDSGSTTSPEFTEWLIAALRAHSNSLEEIVLFELDSSGTRIEHLFPLLGFTELAERAGCSLFSPSDTTWRHVDSVAGRPIEVPEILFEVDLVVNVPKLKLHAKTSYTGALKNNFGSVRPKWKIPYHTTLCETIIACNAHLPRQLVIVDGFITLSGRGPAYGTPVRSGVALGSWDPVAADYAGARIAGVPRVLLSHVEQARKAGLGGLPIVRWRTAEEAKFPKPMMDWPRFIAANAMRRT